MTDTRGNTIPPRRTLAERLAIVERMLAEHPAGFTRGAFAEAFSLSFDQCRGAIDDARNSGLCVMVRRKHIEALWMRPEAAKAEQVRRDDAAWMNDINYMRRYNAVRAELVAAAAADETDIDPPMVHRWVSAHQAARPDTTAANSVFALGAMA